MAVSGVAIGRIVHYVIRGDEPGVLGHVKGQHRPAIILRVWEGAPGASVNLLVFLDGSNDFAYPESGFHPPTSIWLTSVHNSGDVVPGGEHPPGTWHFPEYVQ